MSDVFALASITKMGDESNLDIPGACFLDSFHWYDRTVRNSTTELDSHTLHFVWLFS